MPTDNSSNLERARVFSRALRGQGGASLATDPGYVRFPMAEAQASIPRSTARNLPLVPPPDRHDDELDEDANGTALSFSEGDEGIADVLEPEFAPVRHGSVDEGASATATADQKARLEMLRARALASLGAEGQATQTAVETEPPSPAPAVVAAVKDTREMASHPELPLANAAAPIPVALPVESSGPQVIRPELPRADEVRGPQGWDRLMEWALECCNGQRAFLMDERGLLIAFGGDLGVDECATIGARLVLAFEQADLMEPGGSSRSLAIEFGDGWLTGLRVPGHRHLTMGVMADAALDVNHRQSIGAAIANKLALS